MGASFTSADPTLRHTLKICGIAFAPVAGKDGDDWFALYAEESGWPLGVPLGVFTAHDARMVIRSTLPGQTIRDAFLARVRKPAAAAR